MQVCADLYSVATADSLLSEGTVKLLTEVLYELPDLGDALLRAVGLVHLRLEIHIACLHHSLDELSAIDATSNISACEPSDMRQNAATVRFYQLLALFDVPAKEAAEKEGELQRLWLRIVNLLSRGTTVLDRTMVLSCLLAEKSQSVCRWFVKLLNTADLQHLISRNTTTEIGSMYRRSTTASCTLPISSFISKQTLSTGNTGKAQSEEEVTIDNVDGTGIMRNLSSNVNDDIVCITTLSSTASPHTAWYHLYLMCFERRIHFLDLFLVRNIKFMFNEYTLHIVFVVFCTV